MKAMNKVWVIGDASVDLVPEKQNSYLKCPGGASANVGYMRLPAGRRVRFYWLSW